MYTKYDHEIFLLLRTWKKKEQEEYTPDESLEQVALSLINFEEFFEEIAPQKGII